MLVMDRWYARYLGIWVRQRDVKMWSSSSLLVFDAVACEQDLG